MPADYTVSLKCATNDGETAIGACHLCRDPICDLCVASREGDAFVCRRCAYQGAVGGVGQRLRRERDVETKAVAAAKGTGRRRRIAGLAGLAATLAVLGVFVIPRALAVFAPPRPFAVGAQGDADSGLDACIDGLWRVRASFNRYRHKSGGAVPVAAKELEGAPQTCPGCGGAWHFESLEGNRYRVACPEPVKHGRADIFIDEKVGPPQVVLDRGASR